MAVSVKVITDGPLMVKGECEMQDGQGNEIGRASCRERV